MVAKNHLYISVYTSISDYLSSISQNNKLHCVKVYKTISENLEKFKTINCVVLINYHTKHRNLQY